MENMAAAKTERKRVEITVFLPHKPKQLTAKSPLIYVHLPA